MTSYAFFGAIEMGFAYGLMVIGVYLTFRILDFPDLTVDGSLPLGAAVTAICIASGYSPMVAIVFAACAGFLAGAMTGILNTKFKILHLLASILTMISLYSINLRIMGRPNMTLLGQDTVVDRFIEFSGMLPYLSTPLLFFIICSVVVAILIWFLHTETGLAFLATGDNKQMITSQGVNTDTVIIFGVGLSNALVAVSGSLVAQNQGAADVNMGVGTIIAGLASVIIGETVFGDKTISRALIAALLGSIMYRVAIALALGLKLGDFSFTPSDLNLITAILVIIALVMPKMKKAASRKGRTMISVSNITKAFHKGDVNEVVALNGVNLEVNDGDFITIIGSNGAGKSTFLNALAGTFPPDTGSIVLDNENITLWPEHKRASLIGRVFQDPLLGTCAGATIEQNLAMAYKRGQRRGLSFGVKSKDREFFKEKLSVLKLGLEDRLKAQTGLLSGGQRQALTMLMATLVRPNLLLLDEHTAALDPKTGGMILDLTHEIVSSQNLTALMVTHNMKQAITMGNRLIMFHRGEVVLDISGEEKRNLEVEDLLLRFSKLRGEAEISDRMLLS